MKRIILILLLFLPVFCFSQNKNSLSNFWSIPWGVSMEQVETVLKERGFESSRHGSTLISEAPYEGRDSMMVFMFNNANRFYSGNVIYQSNEYTVIPMYNDYRFVLARRYGGPDTAVEYYEEPFRKGDRREIEAIRTENAFFFTEWQFRDGNQASVSILSNLDVCLTFRSPAYADPN